MNLQARTRRLAGQKRAYTIPYYFDIVNTLRIWVTDRRFGRVWEFLIPSDAKMRAYARFPMRAGGTPI